MAKKVRRSTQDPEKPKFGAKIYSYFNPQLNKYQDAPEDPNAFVDWEKYTPSAAYEGFEYVAPRMTDKEQQDYTNKVNNAQVFGSQIEKQAPRKNTETYEENNALIKEWGKNYWDQQLKDQEAAKAAREKEKQRLMQEFVDQQNASKSPLQSSFGNLSLDNPSTRSAARTYAEYKLGESNPKNLLDKMFTGSSEVGLRDFYRPHEASMTLTAPAIAAAATAAPAVAAASPYVASFLSPLAGPLLNPITGEALAGGTLTFQNALNAYFVANGVKNLPETYKAWEKAFTSEGKGYEDVKDAATTTLVNALDFIGAGEGKEGAKMIAKDISKGYNYAKSFANKGYDVGKQVAKKVLQKVDDAPIVQAWRFDDKTGKMSKEVQAANEEYYKIQEKQDELYSEIADVQQTIKERNAVVDKRFRTYEKFPFVQGYKTIQNQERMAALDKVSKFTQEGEGLVAVEGSPFNKITTTGENTVIDLKTGKPIQAKVEPIGNKIIYKKEAVDAETLAKYPGKEEQLALKREGLDRRLTTEVEASKGDINPEYVETLKSNIKHIEETIPGTKIYGSSVGVSEGGLPHLTGDYDALITESAYNANVKNQYKSLGQKGPAEAHDFGVGGEQGHIDFNIIHENPDGTVRIVWQQFPGGDARSLEVELFRQFAPKEFYEASKEAIRTGQEIKIPFTAKELMDKVDPVAKTIMDAYESTKMKHMNRIDSYINFGNPEAVAKAQQQYVNSVVGEGSIGPQFSTQQLSNVAENKEILNEIGFIGDANLVANSPERMQIALNDFYINNTIFSRQVGTSRDLVVVENSLKYWKPSAAGGSANGWGLNTVRKGNPNHRIGGEEIIGHRQVGIKVSETSPKQMVSDVKRATDGDYIFTPEEQAEINQIIESVTGGKIPEQVGLAVNLQPTVTEVKKSKDLLALPSGSSPKTQEIYNEITKKLGIKAASNKLLYGESAYYSMLGDFDAAVDKLAYTFNRTTSKLKSFDQRTGAFSSASGASSAPVIKDVREFEKLERYINGGAVKAQARVDDLRDSLRKIDEEVDKYRKAYSKGEKAKIDELMEQRNVIQEQMNEASNKYWELAKRQRRLATIRKESGLLMAGAGTVAGLSYYMLNQPDVEKNLENFRDNFGTGVVDEEEEEKYFEQKRSGGFNYTKNMLNANSVGGPRSAQSWQDPGVNEFSGNTNGVKAAYYLKKGGLKQKVSSKFKKLKN